MPNLQRALYLNTHIAHSQIAVLRQQDYPYELCQPEVPSHLRHAGKRREYAYSRQLLYHLAPELARQGILLQSQKKPVANGHKPYFSISHSAQWVSVIVSHKHTVSIDIQINSEARLQNIASRFLSPYELQRTLPQLSGILTALWSVKECVYKYFFPEYSIPFALIDVQFELADFATQRNILQRPLVSLLAPYTKLPMPQLYLYPTEHWSLSFIT